MVTYGVVVARTVNCRGSCRFGDMRVRDGMGGLVAGCNRCPSERGSSDTSNDIRVRREFFSNRP